MSKKQNKQISANIENYHRRLSPDNPSFQWVRERKRERTSTLNQCLNLWITRSLKFLICKEKTTRMEHTTESLILHWRLLASQLSVWSLVQFLHHLPIFCKRQKETQHNLDTVYHAKLSENQNNWTSKGDPRFTFLIAPKLRCLGVQRWACVWFCNSHIQDPNFIRQ